MNFHLRLGGKLTLAILGGIIGYLVGLANTSWYVGRYLSIVDLQSRINHTLFNFISKIKK